MFPVSAVFFFNAAKFLHPSQMLDFILGLGQVQISSWPNKEAIKMTIVQW